MLIHPKNPRIRRILIMVEVAALAGALIWMGWRTFSGTDVSIRLVDVSGFTDDLKVWMRYNVEIDITNQTGGTIGIDRIDVEPDLDGFNEAYGQAVPYLSPPLLVEGRSTARHIAMVTLLNAAQLPERTYQMVFRVRVETEDGDTFIQEFPAEFDYSREPSRRALRR